MREIKVRGWDGEKMYYATLEDLIDAMGSQGAGDWTLVEQVGEELAGFAGRLRGRKQMIYMLFTGQLDKHGKEIFESDILKDQYARRFEIKTGACEAYLDGLRFPYCGVYVTSIDDPTWDFASPLYHPGLDQLEIIGNIHEHPELMRT